MVAEWGGGGSPRKRAEHYLEQGRGGDCLKPALLHSYTPATYIRNMYSIPDDYPVQIAYYTYIQVACPFG